MRIIVSALLSLFLLTAQPASAQSLIPGSEFDSGPWHGEAYIHDDTGRWSYCAVGTYYAAFDTWLLFLLADDGRGPDYMTIRFVSGTPVFAGVDSFELAVRIDRTGPMFGTAQVAPEGDLADVALEDTGWWLGMLRRGSTLFVDSRFGAMDFRLQGSSRALAALTDCAAAYRDYAGPAPGSTVATAGGWSPTPDQTTMMYQIATRIISDAGQQDFTFLTSGELEALGFSGATGLVMWRALGGSFIGGVGVGRVTGAAIDIPAENAGDIATLTRRCAGDIASVSRSYDVDGQAATELVGLCTTTKGTVETTITRMNIGGVLVETFCMYTARAGAAGKPAAAGRVSGEAAAFAAASLVTKTND